MCIGDGQVQAGPCNRGMGVCCSEAVISLMEGALPSVLWQPKKVLVKEGNCEGMHGRMREHGAPPVDPGVGEGMGFGRLECGPGA